MTKTTSLLSPNAKLVLGKTTVVLGKTTFYLFRLELHVLLSPPLD